MKKVLVLATALTFCCIRAFGWGHIGHDAIAYIAECNLTPTAKANIERYLDGQSIVYYSSWMDYVRDTDAYRHTGGWHSASVDENGKHKLWHKRYRVYDGINQETAKLADYRNMTDSAVAVSIKLLVHLVGDMHCPSHTFFQGRPQGFSFTMYDKEYRFHKFWDSELLFLAHKWTYTEYGHQLDRCTPEQKQAITNGSLIDWIEENAADVRPVYDRLTPDVNLSKTESRDFELQARALCDNLIRKAGYRLAHVLNGIFDPEYAH